MFYQKWNKRVGSTVCFNFWSNMTVRGNIVYFKEFTPEVQKLFKLLVGTWLIFKLSPYIVGMTIRMNINELNLVQEGPSWIETIFMQIKEVAARYENLLILSSGYHRGHISLWSILKCMEYHENIIGFTSIFFTSSMDIIDLLPMNYQSDYIENLGNTKLIVKIGFIMVKIVCMSAEFNSNGQFKNF